jgi:hypothetical protein
MNHTLENINRRVSTLTERMHDFKKRLPVARDGDGSVNNDDNNNRGGASDEEDDDDEQHAAQRDARLRDCLRRNQHRVGGNRNQQGNNQNRNNDPFAKVKFTIPSFFGVYDADAYLDWEMTVEQKFNSHLVPGIHRVRQATSEFMGFAIIWWNELVNQHLQPDSWARLKDAMRNRFVPPSYQRDLRKKLQRLDQGSMTVQEYYQELQKGMLRCGVVEDTEDRMAHFYGGLRLEIQDIIDYKEYTTVNRLFELAMLAEKELQGSHKSRSNVGSTFMPRTTMGQARTTPSLSLRPSVSPASMTTWPTAIASTTHAADSGKTTATTPAKSASSVASTCRSSGIRCHKCQGVGHMKKDCPSQRAYIATDDGGYISTSMLRTRSTTPRCMVRRMMLRTPPSVPRT